MVFHKICSHINFINKIYYNLLRLMTCNLAVVRISELLKVTQVTGDRVRLITVCFSVCYTCYLPVFTCYLKSNGHKDNKSISYMCSKYNILVSALNITVFGKFVSNLLGEKHLCQHCLIKKGGGDIK